jgi:hypothetical protein
MNGLMGKILLLGSGETSHAGGQAFEVLAREQKIPLQIRVLETPAGFELNSDKVAGRIADFLKVRLQNYQPSIKLVPARRKGGINSTDTPEYCEQLADADLIFLGPGSPTYTIRHLKDSLIWQALQAAFLQGSSIALASAATIAFGRFALPVYEIYKVGEDPFWNMGLNFLSLFGLEVSFVPHWNNSDGGTELDTSRCFLGRSRYETLSKELPALHPTIGLDEQTGLILDISNQAGKIVGKGQVHLQIGGHVSHFSEGDTFSLSRLGDLRAPDLETISADIWSTIEKVRITTQIVETVEIPEQIKVLVEKRNQARSDKDWATSDQIRGEMRRLGWQVTDTPDGVKVEPIK